MSEYECGAAAQRARGRGEWRAQATAHSGRCSEDSGIVGTFLLFGVFVLIIIPPASSKYKRIRELTFSVGVGKPGKWQNTMLSPVCLCRYTLGDTNSPDCVLLKDKGFLSCPSPAQFISYRKYKSGSFGTMSTFTTNKCVTCIYMFSLLGAERPELGDVWCQGVVAVLAALIEALIEMPVVCLYARQPYWSISVSRTEVTCTLNDDNTQTK